ncbi:hypothetical protein FNF27_06651 [Cafeteria roenbergensis]|uniref:Uncharacterized protein n=1 Tax=Cafeteria roenbergensis TaxID=33653 RepID=A0A5A8E0G3_CAFRO|nr:hypothetical protein FNF27_06651 [Cafeteria roenbergensis]
MPVRATLRDRLFIVQDRDAAGVVSERLHPGCARLSLGGFLLFGRDCGVFEEHRGLAYLFNVFQRAWQAQRWSEDVVKAAAREDARTSRKPIARKVDEAGGARGVPPLPQPPERSEEEVPPWERTLDQRGFVEALNILSDAAYCGVGSAAESAAAGSDADVIRILGDQRLAALLVSWEDALAAVFQLEATRDAEAAAKRQADAVRRAGSARYAVAHSERETAERTARWFERWPGYRLASSAAAAAAPGAPVPLSSAVPEASAEEQAAAAAAAAAAERAAPASDTVGRRRQRVAQSAALPSVVTVPAASGVGTVVVSAPRVIDLMCQVDSSLGPRLGVTLLGGFLPHDDALAGGTMGPALRQTEAPAGVALGQGLRLDGSSRWMQTASAGGGGAEDLLPAPAAPRRASQSAMGVVEQLVGARVARDIAAAEAHAHRVARSELADNSWDRIGGRDGHSSGQAVQQRSIASFLPDAASARYTPRWASEGGPEAESDEILRRHNPQFTRHAPTLQVRAWRAHGRKQLLRLTYASFLRALMGADLITPAVMDDPSTFATLLRCFVGAFPLVAGDSAAAKMGVEATVTQVTAAEEYGPEASAFAKWWSDELREREAAQEAANALAIDEAISAAMRQGLPPPPALLRLASGGSAVTPQGLASALSSVTRRGSAAGFGASTPAAPPAQGRHKLSAIGGATARLIGRRVSATASRERRRSLMTPADALAAAHGWRRRGNAAPVTLALSTPSEALAGARRSPSLQAGASEEPDPGRELTPAEEAALVASGQARFAPLRPATQAGAQDASEAPGAYGTGDLSLARQEQTRKRLPARGRSSSGWVHGQLGGQLFSAAGEDDDEEQEGGDDEAGGDDDGDSGADVADADDVSSLGESGWSCGGDLAPGHGGPARRSRQDHGYGDGDAFRPFEQGARSAANSSSNPSSDVGASGPLSEAAASSAAAAVLGRSGRVEQLARSASVAPGAASKPKPMFLTPEDLARLRQKEEDASKQRKEQQESERAPDPKMGLMVLRAIVSPNAAGDHDSRMPAFAAMRTEASRSQRPGAAAGAADPDRVLLPHTAPHTAKAVAVASIPSKLRASVLAKFHARAEQIEVQGSKYRVAKRLHEAELHKAMREAIDEGTVADAAAPGLANETRQHARLLRAADIAAEADAKHRSRLRPVTAIRRIRNRGWTLFDGEVCVTAPMLLRVLSRLRRLRFFLSRAAMTEPHFVIAVAVAASHGIVDLERFRERQLTITRLRRAGNRVRAMVANAELLTGMAEQSAPPEDGDLPPLVAISLVARAAAP